ncbi:12647_t:CDS:2, partial [Gigaspora margarita]
VDLAEQVFGANHARSRLANEINKWYPISEKINNDIKRACVEHRHGGCWNTPNYHINDIIYIDMKEYYPAIVVNRKLPKDDITGFAQVRSFKFAPNIHSVIPVWYGKNFACQGGDECIKEKRWAPIVLLQYLLGANEDELDFLIKDCTNAGTFAGREKCPLGFILTYYEGHQPQYTHLQASILAYAHINLLEMLRRFELNEVVRIATDSIYVQKEALYKIKNVPAFFKQEKAKDLDLCPHTYPFCTMLKNDCKRHKPCICRFCFGEWFYKPDSYALLHQPEEQEIREIQPGQWHDKGEKIYGPNANIVYWPKNRYWESIKDITEISYLNGGGGSGKTTRAIQIFKDINMIVFTYMNALAKDFQNNQQKCQVICCGNDAQPPPFFGEMPHNWLKERANYYKEVLTDYWAKCPRLQELKKKMRCQNNRVQSDLFCEALPVAKKWEYLESEWKPSD